MTSARITLSLPPSVSDDLDYASSLIGVSRSSLTALILEDVLRTLIPAAEYYAGSAPGEVSPLESAVQGRRLRGESSEGLRDAYKYLRRVADSIDPDSFELTSPLEGGR